MMIVAGNGVMMTVITSMAVPLMILRQGLRGGVSAKVHRPYRWNRVIGIAATAVGWPTVPALACPACQHNHDKNNGSSNNEQSEAHHE